MQKRIIVERQPGVRLDLFPPSSTKLDMQLPVLITSYDDDEMGSYLQQMPSLYIWQKGRGELACHITTVGVRSSNPPPPLPLSHPSF